MRPSVVVGPENGRWLARSPWSTSGLQSSGGGAPVQFLHVDDLAAAVVTVAGAGVDGPVNAAPDGWLTADQVKALKGPTPRLRVRRDLAVRLARWGPGSAWRPATRPRSSPPRRRGSSPTTASAASAGSPTFTNEEAYVDADRGGPWARLTPATARSSRSAGRRWWCSVGAGVVALAGAAEAQARVVSVTIVDPLLTVADERDGDGVAGAVRAQGDHERRHRGGLHAVDGEDDVALLRARRPRPARRASTRVRVAPERPRMAAVVGSRSSPSTPSQVWWTVPVSMISSATWAA